MLVNNDSILVLAILRLVARDGSGRQMALAAAAEYREIARLPLPADCAATARGGWTRIDIANVRQKWMSFFIT